MKKDKFSELVLTELIVLRESVWMDAVSCSDFRWLDWLSFRTVGKHCAALTWLRTEVCETADLDQMLWLQRSAAELTRQTQLDGPAEQIASLSPSNYESQRPQDARCSQSGTGSQDLFYLDTPPNWCLKSVALKL